MEKTGSSCGLGTNYCKRIQYSCRYGPDTSLWSNVLWILEVICKNTSF